MKNLVILSIVFLSIKAQAQAPKGERVYTDCFIKVGPSASKSKPSCPEFPGGVPAMKKFFVVNLHTGKHAKGTQMTVSFIVEKDGSVQRIKAEQILSTQINQLALRQVSSSPKWKPAMLNGKPVRYLLAIPVKIISTN